MDAHVAAIPSDEIEAFCLRNHIRKFSLFGSFLTPRFGPSSDVDVLVEFEPDHIPGYFGLTAMELELSGLFGRKVDLRTPAELSHHFRSNVLASAAVQYEGK